MYENQNYLTIAISQLTKAQTRAAIKTLKMCVLDTPDTSTLASLEAEFNRNESSSIRGALSYNEQNAIEQNHMSRLIDFAFSLKKDSPLDAPVEKSVLKGVGMQVNGDFNMGDIVYHNVPPQIAQHHAGTGDNVAGSKIVQPENNAAFPKKELFGISKNRIHSDAAKQAKDCLTEFNEYNNEKEDDETFDHMNIELQKLIKKANGIIKFFANKTAKASTNKVTDWNARLTGLPTKVALKSVYEELAAYEYANDYIEKMIAPKGVCTEKHRENAANKMQDWIKKNLNLFS